MACIWFCVYFSSILCSTLNSTHTRSTHRILQPSLVIQIRPNVAFDSLNSNTNCSSSFFNHKIKTRNVLCLPFLSVPVHVLSNFYCIRFYFSLGNVFGFDFLICVWLYVYMCVRECVCVPFIRLRFICFCFYFSSQSLSTSFSVHSSLFVHFFSVAFV